MPKELSKIIDYVNKAENVNIRIINIGDFLTRFRTGMEEEPEKIDDLIKAYDGLMKRNFPDMPFNKRWSMVMKNIVRFCFMADNNQTEMKRTLKPEPFLVNYLLDPKRYGSATKVLSNYLKCEGENLYLKIYYEYGLN